MSLDSQQDFEREQKALRLLIEQTNGGVLIFSLFTDLAIRQLTIDWLRTHTRVPVSAFTLSKNLDNPRMILASVAPSPRRCLVFLDVEAAFPKLLGYVNLQREQLLESGHALLFWIREEGLRRISEEAPDFWAWRSRVFDFRTAELPELGDPGPHDAATADYTRDDLEEQISFLGGSAPGDFVSQLALGRRQLAVGRPSEAEEALQGALADAQRGGDPRGIAEAAQLLGASKMQRGLLDEAEPLFQQSHSAAIAANSIPLRLAAMGRLSEIALRQDKPEVAYGIAAQMTEIAEKVQDENALISAYRLMGDAMFVLRDLRAAEHAYRRSLLHSEKLNQGRSQAETLTRLSRVYQRMGNYTEAELARKQADRIFSDYGFAPNSAEVTGS